MLRKSRSVLSKLSTGCKEFRRYKRDVALISVPFSGGQPKQGVEHGPDALRNAGLVDRIEALGRKVHDYGDVAIPDYDSFNPEVVDHKGCPVKNSRACGEVSRNETGNVTRDSPRKKGAFPNIGVKVQVAEAVEKGANDGHICVTVGGDHSIATGSIYGHYKARGDLCVLWIDAHNDLNTYQTTPSGNLHGMCLSFLLKGLPHCSDIPGYEWTKPILSPFDIVYIGLRDTDPGEYTLTHELGILTFSMYEVDRYGISTVVERAIESINPRKKELHKTLTSKYQQGDVTQPNQPKKARAFCFFLVFPSKKDLWRSTGKRLDRPMHVSYDIDSLDPSVSPHTGTAVYGGLTLREGLYIGEYVNKLGLLGALDLVEVNPKIEHDTDSDLTVQTGLRVTEACLGKHRSGYVTKRNFDFD